MKNYLLSTFTLLLAGNLLAIDGNSSIISNGISRTFSYHAFGTSVAANLPVFIIMHGDGGSGAAIKGYSGFDAVADAKNFLAVYPNAIGGDWNRAADAVPGDACTGSSNPSNDVLFISDLIDYLCATYHINTNKVYATGHSAGGYMVYNLAVQLTDKIAAFAPVSGSLCGDNTFITDAVAANAPVAIYHIHGDADDTVDYPDPNFSPIEYEEWPLWIFSDDACSTATYTSSALIVAGVQKHVFCSGSKEISLVQIVGGGHSWPSVAGYNTVDAIATFCLAYSLSTGTSCITALNELDNPVPIQVSPNPSQGVFYIKTEMMVTKIEVVNLLGEKVYDQRFNTSVALPFNTEVNVCTLPKGLYIFHISSSGKDFNTGRIVIN